MAKTNLRNAFSQKRVAVPQSEQPSATQQHMRDETNINTIVNRYLKTGVLGNPNATRRPMFGDFSSVDFMHMQNAIADIGQNFASLPARVRSRFQNDPYQLIRFVENPDNKAEAIKLGILPDDSPKKPEAPKVEQTDLVEQAGDVPSQAPDTGPQKKPEKGK